MALAYPVIVVPGITANYLDDRYTLPPETIWSVLTKEYERAALHPDKTQYEAVEPALVRPGQLFEIAYRELVEELRFNLRDKEDRPVPVYPFGYDWRQPLEIAARELAGMVGEVIERTKLIRHYHRDGYGDDPKVSLVGHSMGGLVIAHYLAQAGANARVDRVVTVATPFRGSFESVIKITTGTADLGTSTPSSREREAARVTPALYCLIPDLPEMLDVEAGIPADLFNPDAWQPSIVATIEEYIRLHGLRPGDRKTQAQQLFDGFLRAARDARSTSSALDLGASGLSDERWLCVVGVNAETRVKLGIKKRGQAPAFEFRSRHRQNRWTEADPAARIETGDGTVPLKGALPPFLPDDRIVCVQPDDFDYWELADRALVATAGFHGILPRMNMLHRLIVRFLRNQRDSHQNTWGMPLPGIADDAWRPPLNGGLRIRR